MRIKQIERLHESPFIKEMVMRINPKKRTVLIGKSEQLVIDSSTGEVKGIGMIHQFREVDKEQFIKIYVSEIANLFSLSRCGLKVFGYLLKSMRINRDTVYLHSVDIAKSCGYKT